MGQSISSSSSNDELTPSPGDGGLRLEGGPFELEGGWVARRLYLHVPDVKEGSARLLRTRTARLERLTLELDLEWAIARSLDVAQLAVAPEEEAWVVELATRRAEAALRFELVAVDGLDLELRFDVPVILGGFWDPRPEIRAALDGVLGPAEELGPGRYRFAPIVRALRTLFPARGWKLPDASALRLTVSSQGSKLRLEAVNREGIPHHPGIPPAVPGWAVVDAQADAERAGAAADAALEEDATNLAGLAVRAQLGSADAAPDSERRLLALADCLRRAEEPRRSGWVLTRAARLASPERRARHLEMAAHLRAEDARLLGELADALVPLGRVSAAIRALRRRAALEEDTHERARLHGQAAELLRQEGDAEGALRELERALRFGPRSAPLLVARAEARAALGQHEQAARELDAALDRASPDEQEALLVSALRLRTGLEASALDALAERAFSSSPVAPEVITALLDAAASVGDESLVHRALAAADAWTERPGELSLSRLDLHRQAAALHVAEGRRPQAIAHLRLLTTSPRATGEDLIALERLAAGAELPELVAFARSRRVSSALEARRPSEVIDVFQSTIEEADPSSDAHQTARHALSEALLRFPGDRPLIDLALLGARRAKDSAALIELLQTRLQEEEEGPARAELLGDLARAWRSTGRPLAAARALEEAASLEPDGEWLERVADIHRARDDRGRLAEVLERLADKAPSPRRGVLLAERGRILAALGEDAAAYAAIREALETGAESPVTESLATVLALRLERFEEAERHARGRLEQVPEDAGPEQRLPIWVDLARVAEATGNDAALSEALGRAVDLAEPNTAVGRQLAERRFDELERMGEARSQAELASRLGGESRLPEPDRARWLVRSAERWITVGEAERAETACEVALGFSGVEDEVRDRALAALEAVAREADDAERLAAILERRADRLGDDEHGQRVRLEQLELLEASGAWGEALAAARRAARLFPDSLMLAARLGGLAERVEAPSEAGSAFARAAALAERTPRPELAVGLHARAARAFMAAGDPSTARVHDEAVLEAARVQAVGSEDLLESIERLEAHAHARGDAARRIELLELKARTAEGPEQVAALEAVASLALASGRVDEGLRALEQAIRNVETTDLARAGSLEERLDSARASAGRSRERVPALERRARGARGPAAAGLWLRAAQVLLDDLDDAPGALIRARAAVRSDPNHLEARGLRLELLQHEAPSLELVEVLEEEGSRATDVEAAAGLWREASETLLELDGESREEPSETLRHRAAELARRAAAATPRDPGPLRLALRALRGLDAVDAEELSLLGQLASRTPHPEERVGCHLRRAQLLEASFHNPRSGLAELETVLETPEGVRASALGVFFPERASPEVAFLEWGAQLSERCDEPDREENFLHRLQGELELPRRRAEVAARRARLLSAALSNPEGAERAWREVLALQPEDDAARTALRERYAETGRFEELGEVLGTDVLIHAWRSLRGEPRIGAGKALIRRLDEGPERAEIMLAHAEDLAGAGASVEEVEALLVEVAQENEGQLSARAWHRLARRYEASGDPARALQAELARAEVSDNSNERAEAFASAATLHVAVGDLEGAERSLDEARAQRPDHPAVRDATRAVLSAGGRFEELGRELGPSALDDELQDALDEAEDPTTDGPRILAAARALAMLRSEDPAARWLEVAQTLGRIGAEGLESEALESASASPSEAGERALERLAERAATRGDLAGRVDALRRRYARAEPGAREARGLELVAGLRAWRLENGPPDADGEAETLLLALRTEDEPSVRVDAALEALWLDNGQYRRLGEVLGTHRLGEHADRARAAGQSELERGILRAWARLLEGEERAEVLDRLAENWEQSGLTEAAAEAREGAWQAAPTEARAEQLGASLVSVGDFSRWARAMGPDPVAAWMAEHPDDERRPRAGEALAAAWQDKGGADGQNLGELWTEVGEGFLGLSDPASAERALRSALTADPKQGRARTMLGDLLAEGARFDDLAELDPVRLDREAALRSERNDVRGAAEALSARAERLSGEARANVLAEVATLLSRLEGPAAEEMVLRAVLDAHPGHTHGRERLASLMWKRGAHSTLVDALGPEALLERFDASAKVSPGRALTQLSRAREALPTELRAIADERAAAVSDPEADPEADLLRRVDALAAARFTWDQLGREEDGARVRLALVDVHEETDPIRYREALQDAWDHVRVPKLRARVGLALAELETSIAPGVSRDIWQSIVQSTELAAPDRAQAAERWLESLTESEMYDPETAGLALEAHEVMVSSGRKDSQTLERLARLREASGESPERVAAALTSAMEEAPASMQPELHLRLRDVHESAGQWAQAEPHATAWAEHANRAVDWLSVSELRLWLEDLEGADEASERAFRLEPELPEVHALRVQLAERTENTGALAERLLRFAEIDSAAAPEVRLDRARRAGQAARADADPATTMAAVRLALAIAPTAESLALADDLLGAPELAEERLSVLREAVGEIEGEAGATLRVRLVSGLEDLERREEALTVLAAGLRSGTAATSPLIEAALDPARKVPEAKLLEWAERLGESPGAQRLRTEAAARAETRGDREVARSAWSRVATSARPSHPEGERARTELVRLAREDADPGKLITVLEELAEDTEDEAAAEAAWLEAAEIAETQLETVERAASLLHRGHRALGSERLALAFEELQRRHQRWASLDAWLERQWRDARGGTRAEWAARRGAFLEERGDRVAAGHLFAEAHELRPNPAWALRAAESELATGDPAAAARRLESLLEQPEAEPLAVSAIALRARALAASGRGREALVLLEEETHRRPSADALFDAWVSSLGEQDLLLAQSVLRDASRYAVERRLASVRMGLLAGMDPAAARGELQALAADWSPEYALEALSLCLEVDRPELAREVVEAAVAGQWLHGGAELALDRAELALRSGDPARARSLLDVTVETPRHRARKASLQAARLDTAEERAEGRAAWAEAARSIEPWEGDTALPLWRRVALRAAEDGELELAREVARRAHLLSEDGEAFDEALVERAPPSLRRAEWLQERAETAPPERAVARWRQAAEAWDQEQDILHAEAARHEVDLREGRPSLELARWLQAEERWEELLEVLEGCLEAGVETAPEVENRLWVVRVALRLERPEVARRHLDAARAVGGLDAEHLDAVRSAAEQLGDHETTLSVLQEQGASAPDPAARMPALLAVARLQAERGDPEAALDALTSAVDGKGGRDLRAWAEHAEAWALASDQAERAARAWAIHATTTELAQETGVAFARTADIRWRELEDRRGALAAIDAALRKVPDDLTLTWMAIEMHGDLGDLSALLRHAGEAAERLEPGPARTAFLLETARHEGAAEAWLRALETEAFRPAVLQHLAAAERMSPVPGLEDALRSRGWSLPALAPPRERPDLDGQESLRSELNLGGRWAELAELEAARAESLDDPRARAEAWLGVAGLWGRIDESSARSEVRLALERAVEADPLWPRPLAEALSAAAEDGDHDRAGKLVEALEDLGGPAWIPSRFERVAADVSTGEARIRWLERAVQRDPGHRESLEVLARTLADAGEHAAALRRAELWGQRLDPHLEPEGVGRCRRLRAELLLRMGRPDEALVLLESTDPEDAPLRVRALEAAGAEPELRVEALEASFEADGDVQHLLRAARLGVRLDTLEARASALSTPSEELEAMLVRARAERGDAPALLGWIRRRGRRVAEALPPERRWSVAREAFLRGDPALVAAILNGDEEGAGLDRVFEDAPLERFVSRLRPSEPAEARLLDRLAGYHRPYGTVARSWAVSRVAEGSGERLIDASRGWLLHDPTDARVLRTLLEALPRDARAAPEMARAWLEEGRERSARLEALGTGPRSVPTVARTAAYAGPDERLHPAAEEPRLAELITELEGDELVVVYDPDGGLRPRMRADGALVLGALLVQRARREELVFHCVRHRALEADDPAPARKAWLSCGSLAAAFTGLSRRMPYLPRWRSLEDRQRFVLVDPEARDLLTFALVTPIRAEEERSAR